MQALVITMLNDVLVKKDDFPDISQHSGQSVYKQQIYQKMKKQHFAIFVHVGLRAKDTEGVLLLVLVSWA